MLSGVAHTTPARRPLEGLTMSATMIQNGQTTTTPDHMDHSPATTTAPEAQLVTPGPLEGDDPIAHAMYRFANTAKRTWPYPHFVVEGLFPPAFYAEMIRRFPTNEQLPPLNDIYPNRLSVRIGIPDELDALPEDTRTFWRALGQRLGSRDFMRFVLRQYDPVLEDRYGHVVEPHIYLHSDIDSYGIGPHQDIHYKLVSLIFYMPEVASPDMNAASVLIKTDKDMKAAQPYEQEWEGYQSAFTVPMNPNTLFSFAVTGESWHGVRPNPQGVLRRSMQYFIMLPKDRVVDAQVRDALPTTSC